MEVYAIQAVRVLGTSQMVLLVLPAIPSVKSVVELILTIVLIVLMETTLLLQMDTASAHSHNTLSTTIL